MRERDQEQTLPTAHDTPPAHGLSRRQFMRRIGVLGAGLAALPVLAACSGDAAPATTTGSGAVPAATTAAGGATTPAGAATTAGAAAPTPVPPTATAAAGIARTKSNAKVNGKLQILLNNDFHPDHNAFVNAEMSEFCKTNGWQFEITPVAGFQGGGDLKTKLIAQVQAGNAPDVLMHNVSARDYEFNGLLEPMTQLTNQMQELYGQATFGFKEALYFQGEGGNKEEWWATPFHTRVDGNWIRRDVFQANGLDVDRDTETFDKMREAALKVSNPDQKMWGWGLTVNRSGDGSGIVKNILYRFGSVLQDETGQFVRFNSPESIKGLEWLKETYTDPKWAKMLPPGVGAWTDTSNNEAFLAGILAITQNAGTMYAKAVLDKVPFAKDIAYVPYPKRISDGARLDTFSGNRWYLLKNSKNREAVHDLVRHMQTQPVQERIWTISTGYALPAYANAKNNAIIQGDHVAKAAAEIAFADAATSPKLQFTGLRWPGPPNAAVDSIDASNDHTDMVAEILQGRPIPEVVKKYHDKWVQTFKDFGLKGA